jgi:porphobilinogen synthase
MLCKELLAGERKDGASVSASCANVRLARTIAPPPHHAIRLPLRPVSTYTLTMSLNFAGQFPVCRPRRLRQSAAMRRLVSETQMSTSQLVLPLFARSGKRLRKAINAMPGVFQLSPDEIIREATAAHEAGVPTVLLFGIPDKKDAKASEAYAANGIVQQVVRLLKKELPSLLVITDVCLCEYMDHGHCGIVHQTKSGAKILNDPTLKLLAQTAASHAEAGADIVAPSDMMDGRVHAIRGALDKDGFEETPIMSYAAKFASAFYGPFREVAESTPKFGDRRSYQMDAGNANEALREVALDIQEGADIVMVKPALAYLDILHRVKMEFGLPTAAYAVSAEHAMVKAAAANGWIDERAVTLESLLAMRRAGADIIITYAAMDAARWLKGA